MVKFPKNKYCTIADCKTKFTHSTGSHNPFFSIDEFGDVNGTDNSGTKRKKHIIEKNGNIINNKNNSYISMYWGFGIFVVLRNKNGIIEKLETEQNVYYYNFIKDLTEIKI